MKLKPLKKILVGVFVSLFLFSSCIDHAYDLNSNIDLTITVGGENLALPFGNTEEIFLRKFLKVEDSDLLDTLSTGEYWLFKEGDIDDSDFSISHVTINGPVANMGNFLIYPKPATPNNDIELEYSTTITGESDFILEKEEMPYEIISIISFDMINGPSLLKFSFDPIGPARAIMEIHFTELEIVFPDFIVFEPNQPGLTGNTLKLQNEVFTPQRESSYVKQLYIRAFNFSNELRGQVVLPDDHHLKVVGEVTMRGTVKSLGIRNEQVTEDIRLTSTINVENLPIYMLHGQVDPEIDVEDTIIDFGGLPDFLQDDDVRMDLTDPQIYVSIENPAEVPIRVWIDMQGMRDGSPTMPDKIKAGYNPADPIIVPPLSNSILKMSRFGGIDRGDTINVKVEDLNELVIIVPDEILIEIEAKAYQQQTHRIELGHTYTMKTDYEIDFSLAFNVDALIVYRDTMDGWNDDIKKYEIKQMYLHAEAENTIPLRLNLEGYGVNKEGEKIAEIEVEIMDGKYIEPCQENGSPSVTSIVMELTSANGAMKELDGLVLRIHGNPNETTEGMPLNSNQFLIMKGMKAKVPGGIKMDLN